MYKELALFVTFLFVLGFVIFTSITFVLDIHSIAHSLSVIASPVEK